MAHYHIKSLRFMSAGKQAGASPAAAAPKDGQAAGATERSSGGGGSRISTASSQRALCWLRNYAALLAPLQAHKAQVRRTCMHSSVPTVLIDCTL